MYKYNLMYKYNQVNCPHTVSFSGGMIGDRAGIPGSSRTLVSYPFEMGRLVFSPSADSCLKVTCSTQQLGKSRSALLIVMKINQNTLINTWLCFLTVKQSTERNPQNHCFPKVSFVDSLPHQTCLYNRRRSYTGTSGGHTPADYR